MPLGSSTVFGQQGAPRIACREFRKAPDSSYQADPLYEPELVAIGNGSLLLRGFESAQGTGYVQEWHCILE